MPHDMTVNVMGLNRYSYPSLLGVIWVTSLGLCLVMEPTWDVAWRLEVVRRLIDGAVFYKDIIEINPPLWFWSIMPSSRLAQVLGISPYALMCVTIHLVAVAAIALLSVTTRPLMNARARQWFVSSALICLILLPISQNGQREPPFIIASVLWACLVVRRHKNIPTPIWMSIAIAFFAAYGFALKHYYLVIPISFEIWLAFALKSKWRPFRAENLTLGLLAIVYAFCVVRFAPHFLTDMVPLVKLGYAWVRSEEGIMALDHILFMTGQIIIILVPVFLVARALRDDPMARALLICLGCHLLVLVLQGKGFSNHFLGSKAATIFILAYVIGKSGVNLIKFWVQPKTLYAIMLLAWIGVPTLAAFVSQAQPAPPTLAARSTTRLSATDTLLGLINWEPEGSRIFVLSTHPGAAFFEQSQLGHMIYTRYFSMWMIPGLINAQQSPSTRVEATAQLNLVIANTVSDIQCSAPHLILDEKLKFMPPQALSDTNPTPGTVQILQTNDAFKSWFEKNYDRAPPQSGLSSDVSVWRAKTKIGPMLTNCTAADRISVSR
jgi:hypothetical protein